MKKNLMTKCKVVAVMGLAVICLVACKGNNEDDKAIETTIAVENETKYDVDAKIAAAKSEADVIEKKLTEDGSLTQTEMNQLATELYTIWDNTMNDMYNVLKDTVSKNVKESFVAYQESWVEEREMEIKKIQIEYKNGSMATMAAMMKAAEMTEERVNSLMEYFSE
ncbi:MAG: lysozyme inhibitor LprI family protein [Lachnospiraceae bacterium]|nr:lysozyme inhibitor LprI family protein [Lachnospiraceae bacterium]